MEKEKRYAVQISDYMCLYIFANNDEQAKVIASKYCDAINQLNDAKATTDVLVEIPFGSMSPWHIRL